RLAPDIDPSRPVESYSIASRQLIEIARALAFDARVFIMDEPTSALAQSEVERLLHLMETLKSRGCGVIYISHKMSEIARVADRITVLRDGRHIITEEASALSPGQIVKFMVGRELSQQYPRAAAN